MCQMGDAVAGAEKNLLGSDDLSRFLRFAIHNIRLFQIASKIRLKLYA